MQTFCSHLILLFYNWNHRGRWDREALSLLAGSSFLVFFLPVVEEAGSVKITGIADSLSKQLHHLKHTGKGQPNETKGQYVNVTTCFGSRKCTDLVIGNERNTVVNGHSADDEVILYVASVVIGQVDHQVNMSPTDQSVKHQIKNIKCET